MAHDIIDNRDLKLIDELAARFPSSDKAKFAVGYFFFSGLEPLADKLYNLSELRLLIGNTTNKETIEQISEGYRRLEPVQDTIEALRYPKRSDIKARMDATVTNMRESVELMEQTDASQQLVSTLVQLIAEKRLQVRVYNRGRLHAKAYIFDYTQMYDASGRALPRTDPGVAIIGSSNFTLSDISHNTELNVVVHGKDNHFQRVAVRQAIQTITRYNGCFVADVVGLGKSYIGAAIVKHFERVERARPLIICPKPLLSMWERYNEIYQLNAHVLSMSMLRNDDDGINRLLSDVKYKDRDFVLVDESHNFRNPDAQRYQILQQYLESGRRCVLLTATPRTRDAWDIYHQLRLFHMIGEDAAVLDPSEALNEQAMYAIYTGEHPEDLEEDEDDGMIGLNEAEELLRQLREDNPQEYERIVNLRNGIRSGRYSSTKGRMIFCQAGSYQQLMLLDDQHTIITRDISVILKALRCAKDEIILPVDASHNQAVSSAKTTFGQEAAQRRIEQQHTRSLTTAQRYILRELRAFFAQADTEDLKAQTSLLEATFRCPLTRTLSSELNALKRADLAGLQLVRELSQLYTRYHLDQQRQQQRQDDEVALPYIVCSEVLV